MRHTISILVENKFGVLTRVAGLFSGRGYNIDTLNVAPTHEAETSRMTIVTRGDDATLEQIVKQLKKLVNVIEVQDFREGEFVDRELVLVKVNVDSKSRAEVMQITDIFRAKIVDVQPKSLTVKSPATKARSRNSSTSCAHSASANSRAPARSPWHGNDAPALNPQRSTLNQNLWQKSIPTKTLTSAC